MKAFQTAFHSIFAVLFTAGGLYVSAGKPTGGDGFTFFCWMLLLLFVGIGIGETLADRRSSPDS